MTIGFLFNHYEPHQIAHSAPIAFALSQRAGAPPVTIYCASRRLQRVAAQVGRAYPGHRCQIRLLRLPLPVRVFAWLIKRWKPRRKQWIQAFNISTFSKLTVLVVPERTSLKLKRHPKLRTLKMVRIRHGAGDRTTGLDETNRQFDLILASGQKMVDRLAAEGVPSDQCRIVGYPKFDYARHLPPPPRLFKNQLPVVLYNPHFNPMNRPWPRFGLEVLAFFQKNQDYNLIFAPHIMLAQQPGLVSRKSLSPYQRCPNIHIDLGSTASIDMTYTRMADLYLGDVSSQVYEFLLTPRPCIFLNAHNIAWQGNLAFAQWQCGPVLDTVVDLPVALQAAVASPESYRPIQQQLFAYTFDLTAQSSAERGADALQAFVI